jgi:hypothetical protein
MSPSIETEELPEMSPYGSIEESIEEGTEDGGEAKEDFE